jgi:hypothetical protein
MSKVFLLNGSSRGLGRATAADRDPLGSGHD